MHFWDIFEKNCSMSVKENTLNGEISTTNVYISVNNNTNLIFLQILSIYTALYEMDETKIHLTLLSL